MSHAVCCQPLTKENFGMGNRRKNTRCGVEVAVVSAIFARCARFDCYCVKTQAVVVCSSNRKLLVGFASRLERCGTAISVRCAPVDCCWSTFTKQPLGFAMLSTRRQRLSAWRCNRCGGWRPPRLAVARLVVRGCRSPNLKPGSQTAVSRQAKTLGRCRSLSSRRCGTGIAVALRPCLAVARHRSSRVCGQSSSTKRNSGQQ